MNRDEAIKQADQMVNVEFINSKWGITRPVTLTGDLEFIETKGQESAEKLKHCHVIKLACELLGYSPHSVYAAFSAACFHDDIERCINLAEKLERRSIN